MTATALVLFMTLPGLALFYASLVRPVNVLSVMMQCFAIAGIMSILWVLFGYTLAFGEGGKLIGDFSRVLAWGMGTEAASGSIPENVFLACQMTFAVITRALIVGAFPERMKFSSILAFSILWLLAVYVPVCRWVWGAAGSPTWASRTSRAASWFTRRRACRRWCWPPCSAAGAAFRAICARRTTPA